MPKQDRVEALLKKATITNEAMAAAFAKYQQEEEEKSAQRAVELLRRAGVIMDTSVKKLRELRKNEKALKEAIVNYDKALEEFIKNPSEETWKVVQLSVPIGSLFSTPF